ncbi:FAD-binding oxidoreductase [Actinoplanes sp. RD1]|uniref:FAD-binding oxidoreductase n=1 Tax=Actinoplanes sp. RD1 TaxID=3064538 RepID=UPI0027422C05|nr:FAD-binding oxidoreductase [Actinoplanes sp. RD1]
MPHNHEVSADEIVAALTSHVRPERIGTGEAIGAAVPPWNAAVTDRPAAVIRCLETSDVQAGIMAAQRVGVPLTVYGRGHDWAGRALRPGGLVLDLSGLNGVRVNPAAGLATVGGGTSVGELLSAAGEHGLVAVTGTVDSVGMVGLATGGGYGPLSGRFGLAADNLAAATVALADGSVVEADEDLLWALRGGGGNFGVVVEARFNVHRVPSVVGGTVIYPFDQAGQVLKNLRELHEEMPDELTVQTALLSGPDGAPVVLLSPTWVGPRETGLAEDGPVYALTRLGTPAMAMIAEKRLADGAAELGAMFPYGRQVEISTRSVPTISDEVAAALIEHVARKPSPFTAVALHSFHGAAARVAPGASAFGTRVPHHMVEIISVWTDTNESPVQRQWARDLSAALQPYALEGGYPNLLGPDAVDQIPLGFGGNAGRLRALKDRYDPAGVFRAIPLPF